MQTIGERLEEARKKKGISIREAAEATKIRSDYLQKFESNHFDIGLTEIYTRGFLRTYANFLKLPADRLLNDYAALSRGEARSPRQPNREVYGRLDVTTATTSEPADRASPSDEAAPTAEPRTARTGRTRAPASLPSGPDPAVVYRYVKWGGIAVVAIILILAIKSLLPSGSPAPRSTTPATPPAQTATPPATPQIQGLSPSDQSITLIARDVVGFVSIARKNPDGTDGEEIFRGPLSRGEQRPVLKPGPIWITTNAAENLVIGFRGREYPIVLNGERARGYQKFGMD